MPLASLLLALAPALELQPKTYASPSGLWTLRVEPATREGTGAADYVMTGGSKEAWRARHPFALWDVVVTDDGRVGGYAYCGEELQASDGGSFRVVIFAPKGEVLLDEAHPRSFSGFLHESADPKAKGIFFQEEIQRFVVRVADGDVNRSCEEWWCYDVRTGKNLLRVRPKAKAGFADCEEGPTANSISSELAVHPIRGTRLALVQWWRCDFQTRPTTLGGVFALLGPDLELVWKLELPTDYMIAGDDEAQFRLNDEIWKGGAILSTSKPREFELRLVADGVRATYSVEEAESVSYRVVESGRRPYVADTGTTQEMPVVAPRLLREVPLVDAAPRGAEIRDIEAFGFTAEDHLRFVRSEEEATVYSLVEVDESGRVLRSTRVGPFEGAEERRLEWFALEPPRWIVVEQTWRRSAVSRAWVVDELDGKTQAMPAFPAQDVRALVPLGGNRFVLLATSHTLQDVALALDFDGRVLWSLGQGDDADGAGAIYSPEDLTVTSDGLVVVLEDEYHLQVYDSQGVFQASHDLTQTLGRKPNYPSGLEPDVEGGILFEDFEGRPPLWRLEADGTPRSKLDPRRADGSSVGEYRTNAKVSPHGDVWTTDGDLLLRLDDAGVIDLVLGEEATTDRLSEPGACAIDSTFGRILVQDARTRCVHVLDGEGRRLGVCRPAPDEIDDFGSPMEMSTSRSGEVFAEHGDSEKYLRFDASGASLGVKSLRAVEVAFRPDADGYWGNQRTVLALFGSGKKPELRLQKRPDGQWFRDIESIRCAPDGSLAVLDLPSRAGGHSVNREEGDGVVALFSARGEPLGTLTVPQEVMPYDIGSMRMAATRGWILFDNYKAAFLMKTSDGSVRSLDFAGLLAQDEVFGFSPDGREIWAVAGARLFRFALPE